VRTAGAGKPYERGSVTAEFAAVLPAVILVLAASLATLQIATTQLRLQDASADASRSLGRGDPPGTAAARLAIAVPGATVTETHRGDLVCAEASARSPGGAGLLFGLTLTAISCALDGGG
jgi:Flp pilus assembly protein TadG